MDKNRIRHYAYEKLITLLVSFKLWMIVISSGLLIAGYITAEIFKDLVLGITLGRVAVQGIQTFKTGNYNDVPKTEQIVD